MEIKDNFIQLRPIEERDNEVIAAIIRSVLTEFNAVKRGTVYYDPTTDDLYRLFQKKSQLILLPKCMTKWLEVVVFIQHRPCRMAIVNW